MNWDAIGAVGQALSALALMFVILQLRHSREEMRRSVSDGRSSAMREFFLSFLADSHLTELDARVAAAFGTPPNTFELALVERAGLNPLEARSYRFFALAYFQVLAQQIRSIHVLPTAERQATERNVRAAYDPHLAPAASLWYESTKNGLDQSVVRYIDNLLAQPG